MNLSLDAVKTFDGRLSMENVQLLDAIKEMMKPKYQDINALIKREEFHSRRTYYLEDDSGQLITFFMVNYEELAGKPTIYFGLNAVAEAYKNTGISSLLYMKAGIDAMAIEQKINQKHIVYATTATPSVYNSIQKMSDNFPDYNKELPDYLLEYARAYCLKNGIEPHEYPFVLKGVSQDALYSNQENERIKHIIAKHNFKVFDKYGIEEQKGDRLLLLFEMPSIEKVNFMKANLNMLTSISRATKLH